MGPKTNTEVPGLAVDFIKVMTLDMIDLRNFEKTMSHYRESGGFNGTLVKPKVIKDDSPMDNETMTVRKCNTKKAATHSPAKSTQNTLKALTFQDVITPKTQYVPNHYICEPFKAKDHYAGGEFAGKILIRQTGNRRKKTKELVDSFLDNNQEDADLI